MTNSTLDLAKLPEGKKRGSKTIYPCPACRNAGDDKKGEHLVIFDSGKFGCIAHEGDSAHRKDIFALVGAAAPKKQKPRIVKAYDYTDEKGNVVHQTLRLEPKSFRQRKPDGKGGWIWSLGDTKTLLYNLPEIVSADPKEPVWIVEGEKDADALNNHGHLATTCPMGAGKWREHYNEYLRGRRVIVCPDNDKAGMEHLRTVAGHLEGIASEIKAVNWRGIDSEAPQGYDISEHIAKGHPLDTIIETLTTPADADITGPALTSGEHSPMLDADTFMQQLDGMIASSPENVAAMREMARDAVFILPGIAMAGQYTIINAKWNTGKTLLTLWKLSQRDMELTKGFRIFYINADDTFEGGIEKCELAEKIGAHSLIPNQCGFDKGRVAWLMQAAIETKQAGMMVLILDTLKKFADMMNKGEAREFNLLVRDFVMAGGTVIALAHTNKNTGSDGRSVAEGVGDWASDCDCNYIMEDVDTPDDKKAIVFRIQKLRGPNVMEANFTYDNSEGKTWRERFDSVEEIGKGQVQSLLSDMDADKKHQEDISIILYLEKRIYGSSDPISGSKLTQDDLEEGLPSRRERERVLALYSDANPRELHRHWRRRTGNNNRGYVYTQPDSVDPF